MQTLRQTNKPMSQLKVLKQTEPANEEINKCFVQAQCDAYQGNADAETFFQLNLRLTSGPLSHVAIKASSGKYLPAKSTRVVVTNHRDQTIEFGFNTNKITVSVDGQTQEIDYTPQGNTQAYDQVLQRLYSGNHDLFISPDLAMEALRVITPVLEAKGVLPMLKYQMGDNPTTRSDMDR